MNETNRDNIIELMNENTRLRAEVAALKMDAERYRWLREQQWNTSSLCVVVKPKDAVRLGHFCPSQARLDSAIDAELKDGRVG